LLLKNLRRIFNCEQRKELLCREFYAAGCAPDEFASSIKTAGESLFDADYHIPKRGRSRTWALAGEIGA
jgi:hypothetical protein